MPTNFEIRSVVSSTLIVHSRILLHTRIQISRSVVKYVVLHCPIPLRLRYRQVSFAYEPLREMPLLHLAGDMLDYAAAVDVQTEDEDTSHPAGRGYYWQPASEVSSVLQFKQHAPSAVPIIQLDKFVKQFLRFLKAYDCEISFDTLYLAMEAFSCKCCKR